jgi:O-antigen/teichoic acid export membrane protein
MTENAQSLRRKTASALTWSLLGTFANVLIQAGSVAALGRLLSPSEYGLLTVASVVISFGGYFAQLGLGPALIQRKDIDERDIRSCWTLSLLLGVAAAGATWLAAPAAGWLFHTDAAAPVIRWLSLSFILTGIATTPTSLLRRELRFRSIAWIEGASMALGNGAVAIACAATGCGVWSLVAGVLAQQGIVAVASLATARHSLRPVVSWQAWKRGLGYGAHFSLNSLLDFLYANVELFLGGRLFSPFQMGLYNRGFAVANMPLQYPYAGVSRVLFPVLSRLKDRRERLAEAFLSALALLAMACGSVSLGMMVAGRELVRVMLGETWTQATPALQVLSLAVLMQLLMSVQGVMLDSVGCLRRRSWARAAGLSAKTALVGIGAALYGFEGFLAGILAGQFIQQAIYLPIVSRSLRVSLLKVVGTYLSALLGAGLVAGVIATGTTLCRSANLPAAATLATQAALGAAGLAALVAMTVRYSLCGVTRETTDAIPLLRRLGRGSSVEMRRAA